MALEGTLKDFSLADIFQLISIQKKTGVLTLKDQQDEVTVSFLEGSVVSANSSKKNIENRLGQVLVKSGRITQEQLDDALRTQKSTRQRLGNVLVQDGYIQESDLCEALRLQIAQLVYRLFRWEDGDYHFSQEEAVEYDREHFTPLSAESVLMEGVRMIDEWPIIERKIRSLDMVFRRTNPDEKPVIVTKDQDEDLDNDLEQAFAGAAADEPDGPDEGGGLRLHRDEAVIYELIDGRRNVQELIDRSRMSDFETCRILYDLLSRNLIVEARGAGTSQQAPARGGIRVGPVLEKIAYLTLFAGLTVSIVTLRHSPLSGSPLLIASEVMIDQIYDIVTRNRMERLDEAIQVYYLQKGFYPEDLKELVQGKLVSPSGLKDPWGRRFGFISTAKGYSIVAYGPGGTVNPERTLERGDRSARRPTPPAGDSENLGPPRATAGPPSRR